MLPPTPRCSRTALLEVQVPGLPVNPIIYLAFGTAVPEDNDNDPCHGWIFGYTAGQSDALSQVFAFATTPTGPTGNTGRPPCNDVVKDGFQNAPNWCGLGGGIWMSGRGPAANTVNGVTHVYFATGNGGFQKGGLNWSESVLDFHVTPSAVGTSPADSFTPYGGRYLAPPLQDGVPYIFEALNENDWDLSVSGILLFQDGKGNNRLLTTDKAGYGYILAQGSLGGFEAGDPGNAFSFGASQNLCTVLAYQCDRIVSLAFYNDTLYFWPDHERLSGVKSYNGTTALPGLGAISSAGSTVTGTGTNFMAQIVPGDTIIAGNQKVVVTGIPGGSNTLTVKPPFNPDVTNVAFAYHGLLVNPVNSTVPHYTDTGYPGGSIVIASQGPAPGSGIVWALGTADGTTQTNHGPGTLYAYDAGNLVELWSSPDPFIASSFALPTVVNGNVYIPTYDQAS